MRSTARRVVPAAPTFSSCREASLIRQLSEDPPTLKLRRETTSPYLLVQRFEILTNSATPESPYPLRNLWRANSELKTRELALRNSFELIPVNDGKRFDLRDLS